MTHLIQAARAAQQRAARAVARVGPAHPVARRLMAAAARAAAAAWDAGHRVADLHHQRTTTAVPADPGADGSVSPAPPPLPTA
ncbi:hypothetical protein [Streptomyces sp. NPDC051016]|uniref:hypothetical protein n=1 Tax=Streptomyces sp. NPDC051016 TaxID=3365638 RepID=UPI0037B492AE